MPPQILHLLPMPLYRMTLENCNVKEKDVLELMDIRETRTTIELFEKTARKAGFAVANRHFWFINPHYKAKFGLTPRTLCKAIAAVPYVRDFFTTSAFFLLQKPNTEQPPKQS